MPHAEFVHLRVHSAYSLSEGAVKIKQLIDEADKLRNKVIDAQKRKQTGKG